MEIETTYHLKVSKTECTALVKLLGKMSPKEILEKGLSKEEWNMVEEFWRILPSWEDDEE